MKSSETTFSVALCSYNGATYLGEQLASIAAQTRLPQEVVVCDDGSSDASPQIAREFAEHSPFAVRVEANPQNLGVVGNVEKAISLCRGETIVLADQDDVWMPQKLARIAAEMDADPEIGFVFSDAQRIDDRGESLKDGLWQCIVPPFNAREQRLVNDGRAFDVLLRRNVVTGATLAFRAKYRDLILPLPAYCQHDAWIALLLSAVAPCKAIAEPLIRYRQHASQQLGEKRMSLFQQLRVAKAETDAKFQLIADRHEAARERLWNFLGELYARGAMHSLAEKVEHFRAKVRMRTSAWRPPLIARELLRGHYRRYSLGWKSLAQDLLL
jgi:glycosyltransferase involved in cell wall biosynthesis